MLRWVCCARWPYCTKHQAKDEKAKEKSRLKGQADALPAEKAPMVLPTEKGKSLWSAAAIHFPAGSTDDPAIKKGGVLNASQRRCVDTRANCLDVDNVCAKASAAERPLKDTPKLWIAQAPATAVCAAAPLAAQAPNDDLLLEPKVTKAEAPARLGVKPGEKLHVTFKTTLGTWSVSCTGRRSRTRSRTLSTAEVSAPLSTPKQTPSSPPRSGRLSAATTG